MKAHYEAREAHPNAKETHLGPMMRTLEPSELSGLIFKFTLRTRDSP
jgi:hypothetical protein